MDESRWERIWEIFHQLAETPAAQRAGQLDAACAGDGELRREVESLLAAHDSQPGFLADPPALDPEFMQQAVPDPLLGGSIGPYKIRDVIGEGGMGVVYLAEQQAPVRRRVAVKVLKLGLDSREVIARFESERQALALMNHPGIARVFDAGVSEDGRPYFVMEHVAGKPITNYCDEYRLSISERLELVDGLCHAVQHAHQKGIIHRDLKPSNVLVSIEQEKPSVRIIDFGVAKATNQRLTELTVFTQFGRFIGTPDYMSPEQADMRELDVDTRTDIYSLGVLLYQILTGSLPFDPRSLREGGYDELRRTIREREPPTPSHRITTLGDDIDGVARSRRSEPGALRRQLRGDLDWIVMKSMEKDRSRRYQTASELAADIRRHLANEPVVAGPPSTAYRLGKFVRRHRVAVLAAASLCGALLVGATVATWGLVEARRAEAGARSAAARAEAVSGFLEDVLSSASPEVAQGRDVSVLREMVDDAARRAETEFASYPALEAAIRRTVGRTYTSLGALDPAERQLSASLDIFRELHGTSHADVAVGLDDLGLLLRQEGDFDRAESRHREALEIWREVVPREPERSPDLATSLDRLTWILIEKGRFEEAVPLAQEALLLRERAAGPRATESLVQTLSSAGFLYKSVEDYEAAERYYRRAIAEARSLGDRHPLLATTLNNLGVMLVFTRDYEESQRVLREALEIRREILPPDHPTMAEAYNNMGLVLANMGDGVEGEKMYRESLRILRAVHGETHPYLASTLYNIAKLLADRDDWSGAAQAYERALSIDRASLPDDHPYVSRSMVALGKALIRAGRPADAEAWLREAVRLRTKTYPPGDWRTAEAKGELGDALTRLGRYRDAEPLLVSAFEDFVADGDPELRLRIDTSERRLVLLYEAWGRPADAEPYRPD